MNNFADEEQLDEERGDNEIHLITKSSEPTHITLNEYRDQLMLNNIFNEDYEMHNQDESY